jgi:hypothetical protein
MTGYRLPDHLGVCEVDGRMLMLDLRRDRYFQMDAHSTSALRQWRDGPRGDGIASLLPLIERGILVPAANGQAPAWPATAVPPRRLVETAAPIADRSWSLVPEIAATLALTRWRLRRRGLEGAVDRVRRDRPRGATSDAAEQVARFRTARRLVPLDPNCLTDSLALASVLSRRAVDWKLVFGVKLDPFAAHCWLQNDEAVLNDAEDSVSSFVPIMVI